MGIPLKKLLAGVFLVTSPRLILRSGYGHDNTKNSNPIRKHAGLTELVALCPAK